MKTEEFIRNIDGKIDGKKQEEWEIEFGIRGIIKHLEGLGWTEYQWSTKNETFTIEFLSTYYYGSIQGKSKNSLREASVQCLNISQKYAQCERKNSHTFIENNIGFKVCSNCGFQGYSDKLKLLDKELKIYKNDLEREVKVRNLVVSKIKHYGYYFNIFGNLRKINKEDK